LQNNGDYVDCIICCKNGNPQSTIGKKFTRRGGKSAIAYAAGRSASAIRDSNG
jgi:hypothetical protein